MRRPYYEEDDELKTDIDVNSPWPDYLEMESAPIPERLPIPMERTPIPDQLPARPRIGEGFQPRTPYMNDEEQALRGRMSDMDRPQKPSLLGLMQTVGRGISGQDPAEFRRAEDVRYGEEFDRKQTQKQQLAQQIQQIQAQRQQQFQNARLTKGDARDESAAAREAEAAPVDLEFKRAQTTKLLTPEPVKVDRDPNVSKTLETAEGIRQWNPETGRYDIEAGKKATPLDQSITELDLFRQSHPNGTLEDYLKMKQQFGTPPAQRNIDPLSPEGIAAQKQIKGNDTISGPSAYSTERAARTVQSVDELINRVTPWTVGLKGSLMANIPETDARNFKAELDTLKANIAFNELTAMREASKTGGALGQVSDKESQLLQSALGSLDTGQSPENLKVQLQKIRESVTRWQDAAKTQGGQAPPGGGNAGGYGPTETKTLKDGSTVRVRKNNSTGKYEEVR